MKYLLLPFLLLCLFSCEPQYVNPEGEGYVLCGGSNPLEEVAWLKEQINAVPQGESSDHCMLSAVISGTYDGQTVFIPLLSGALCCICGNAVYDCEGELVFVCDQKKEAKIRNKKVIWERK